MDEQLTIPIPVTASRYTPTEVLRTLPGNHISWNIGDRAIYTGTHGTNVEVIIKSERVGHKDAPGKPCRECQFPDGMFCVIEAQLRWGS